MTIPNAELAYRVLDHIDAHPEQWSQHAWMTVCGTAFCFAGWAVNLSGCALERINGVTEVVAGPEHLVGLEVWEAADLLLRVDMSAQEADLYDGFNSRVDLDRIVEDIFGPRPRQVAS